MPRVRWSIGCTVLRNRAKRSGRGRAVWKADPLEGTADQGNRSGLTSQAQRRRHARELVGWQDTVGLDRQELWNQVGRAAMSTLIPHHGCFSPAKMATFFAAIDTYSGSWTFGFANPDRCWRVPIRD